jgi:ADP-ribose pyrophosphatase YjhB (NUDIX family)
MAEESNPITTVGAFVFNHQNKVLFLKSDKWNGLYVPPCGKVRFGEPLERAVEREVEEETGLKVRDIVFIEVLEFIDPEEFYMSNQHFIGHQYACKAVTTDVKLNYEAQDYRWFIPGQATRRKDIEPRSQHALKRYLLHRSHKIK